MRRVLITERPDWRTTAEALGFCFHTIEGEPYWDERAYYAFTLQQIEDELEQPTNELHAMCMDMLVRVINSEQLLSRLGIPDTFYDLIANSWRAGHRHLYGRMDLSYSGLEPAKLLELNYDTPTSIYESAAFQWGWLEECMALGWLPAWADQFNSIEDRLRDLFASLQIQAPFYFASLQGMEEDKATTDYLAGIAAQVGIDSRYIALEDIGLRGGRFVDLQQRPVTQLFKLHPWEFIFEEPFGHAIAASGTRFYEPAWKAILSNKGILPLLWEQYPRHPNLLECYLDSEPARAVPKGWVRKPFFSREGANISLCTEEGAALAQSGPYAHGPHVLQKLAPLPCFDGNYTLIGSWVIGDRAAGIGIREDDSLITKDSSRFVPHIILD